MADSALWTIEELLQATGGELVGEVSTPLNGVAIDSRAIKPGDIFVAIKGDRTDGHIMRHLRSRRVQGWQLSRGPTMRCARQGRCWWCRMRLWHLEQMGRAARERVAGKIIAVTGSVGKTTTKDALKVALVCVWCGARGGVIVQQPLGRATDAGAHAARYGLWCDRSGDEPCRRDRDADRHGAPHVAIITAIAESHIGHFESLDRASPTQRRKSLPGWCQAGLRSSTATMSFRLSCRQRHEIAASRDVRGFGEAEDADIRLVRFTLHDSCSCMTADVLRRASDLQARRAGPARGAKCAGCAGRVPGSWCRPCAMCAGTGKHHAAVGQGRAAHACVGWCEDHADR
jgi:UDP-N-acetylmuramyl pentapeptide synthase